MNAKPYYLTHFQTALDWLSGPRAHVLGASDLGFIEQFNRLPTPAQALWVRLISRRPLHFRVSALNYPEVEPLEMAARPLTDLGWLAADQPLLADELYALLRKPELDGLFGRAARKADHRGRLVPGRLAEHVADTTLSLMKRAQIERLRLAFFGDLHQSWNEFVITELGHKIYPKIAHSAQGGFVSNVEFEAVWRLYVFQGALEAGASPSEIIPQVLGQTAPGPTAERKRSQLLLSLGETLARDGETQWALQAFAQAKAPVARKKQALLLERLGKVHDALELATEATQSPRYAVEPELLRPTLQRLQRALGATPLKSHRFRPPELTLPYSANSRPVERQAAEQLTEPGSLVLWCENKLFGTLFTLHHWQALFANLPGAFFNPFQAAPADLSDPDFFIRRAGLIPVHVAPERLLQAYREKSELTAVGLYRGITADGLKTLLSCIPPEDLAMIFARMRHDYPRLRSGFPDLIKVWPAERRYELIEVKGPGDTLQPHQRDWLEFFVDNGIPARVCYVRAQSA